MGGFLRTLLVHPLLRWFAIGLLFSAMVPLFRGLRRLNSCFRLGDFRRPVLFVRNVVQQPEVQRRCGAMRVRMRHWQTLDRTRTWIVRHETHQLWRSSSWASGLSCALYAKAARTNSRASDDSVAHSGAWSKMSSPAAVAASRAAVSSQMSSSYGSPPVRSTKASTPHENTSARSP